MYIAYGWPQAIPLLESGDASSSSSFSGVVYVKVAGHTLLVVTPENLEIWSSSQVWLLLESH